MAATIVTAIFPVFFYEVACEDLPRGIATQRHAVATTIALVFVAIVAPILGALADSRPLKKRLLAMFMGVGVLAVCSMFFIRAGDWKLAATLFVLVNIGASGSFVFYDSLLPHIARRDEMDRVSSAGYALGYLGGGLLLGLNLAWIQFPHWFGLPSGDDLSPSQATLPARMAFVSVGIWWLLFSIPLFRRVPEPASHHAPEGSVVRATFRQLGATFAELRRYRQALLLLVAFLIYNDGILTIIRMSTIYGAEIGLPTSQLMIAILVVNFVGVPCAFLYGALAGRVGAKAMLYASLALFAVISFLGWRLSTPAEFFLLAVLVSVALGGTQALSRSLFASLIPKDKSSEFFAFFGVAEKFAGILGPALFAVLIELTGSSRNAILCMVVFFVAGAALLRRVDVDAGRRIAQAADRDAARLRA
jgi:UMF1 family MFS transporter